MPCKSVSSIAIVDKLLFFVTADGIKNLDLENPQTSAVVVNNEKDNFYPYQVKKIGRNVLFSGPINRRLFIFDQDSASIHAFAGNGNESSVDGPLSDCSFRQPLGIAVEFDNVIYLTDAMSGTVNIISPIKNTVAFLDAVGCLYKAFSVHEKGKTFPSHDSRAAVTMVNHCRKLLEYNERNIYNDMGVTSLPKKLNGPQGNVAAKTVDSVRLIEWGLERLVKTTEKYGYSKTDLLSCMTLNV